MAQRTSLRRGACRAVRFASLALCGVVAAAAVVEPAAAYVRTRPRGRPAPVSWASAEITMTLDTSELPSVLARARVLAVLQRAAARWSRPAVGCTAAVIRVRDGSHTQAGGGDDGRSSVAFHRRRWCEAGVDGAGRCHDPRTAALTTVRLDEARGGEVRIREADIELNAAGFVFVEAEAPVAASGVMDLETVMVHELGHVLGFDHVCGRRRGWRDHEGRALPDCAPMRSSAIAPVMVPAGDEPWSLPPPLRRELALDDIHAVCAVYPARRETWW